LADRSAAGWTSGLGVPVVPYADAPFAPAFTSQQELEVLKAQADQFQGVLENLNKRIAELESEAEKK
jgi:hypothetical protein